MKVPAEVKFTYLPIFTDTKSIRNCGHSNGGSIDDQKCLFYGRLSKISENLKPLQDFMVISCSRSTQPLGPHTI